jgi:3',5'-cyclic AMP phosphodiesterase CpdA
MKWVFYCIAFLLFISCNQTKTVKFAVCTDVHQDLIHDASDRLSDFIQNAKREKVDFIIQLGDFCMPFEKNEPFLQVWESFQGPRYHVLGNHDMDVSPKAFIQEFLGMEKSFYSFDQGDFHFVILDANFFKKDESMVAYSNGNYFSNAEGRCYVPDSQIEWLKLDLAETEKLTIIFSHQSLEHWGGVKNRIEVRRVLEEANQHTKKVIACFCGHDHQDRHAEINEIHYIGLNSTSYAWVGNKLEHSGRFPESIEEKYSNLKYTLPYRESVSAIVEINSDGKLIIKGVQSDFIQPGPEELGAKNHSYSAKISDRVLEF